MEPNFLIYKIDVLYSYEKSNPIPVELIFKKDFFPFFVMIPTYFHFYIINIYNKIKKIKFMYL